MPYFYVERSNRSSAKYDFSTQYNRWSLHAEVIFCQTVSTDGTVSKLHEIIRRSGLLVRAFHGGKFWTACANIIPNGKHNVHTDSICKMLAHNVRRFWTKILNKVKADPTPQQFDRQVIMQNRTRVQAQLDGTILLKYGTHALVKLLLYSINFVFVFDLVLEITVCSAKFHSLWELCWLSQLWVRKFTSFQWLNHNAW